MITFLRDVWLSVVRGLVASLAIACEPDMLAGGPRQYEEQYAGERQHVTVPTTHAA